MSDWNRLAQKALAGRVLTFAEAEAVLDAPDDELLPLLQAAFTVRKHYFGRKVKLNMLINAKSGLCPENCGYCAQSIVAKGPIERYTLLDTETLLKGAEEAISRQATTYCIVTSGRAATDREIDRICEAVREIKARHDLKICACLGLIDGEQAKRLADAGVERFNHNLNTSAAYHGAVTTSHTYDDRVRTVNAVKAAGISGCSGCIVGMGESRRDVYDVACALRELDVDSIPVNFLHAIPGTPLEDRNELTPLYCLKVLALFRFLCPSKEIRASGGREVNLRSLQPLALYPANSLFVGDYLTTAGQAVEADLQMIRDLGFEIETEPGVDRHPLPEPAVG